MTLAEIYHQRCNDNSDICQHLPTLREYASGCDGVIELGVRSIVSTWAFLIAKPKWLLSVDILHPSKYIDHDPTGCDLELAQNIAAKIGVSFIFKESDTLQIELPKCDLIFFDTLHTYHQLSSELRLHGNKASKYLIFHDTLSYFSELVPAISEYLKETNEWELDKIFYNNNGLTILKRIQ